MKSTLEVKYWNAQSGSDGAVDRHRGSKEKGSSSRLKVSKNNYVMINSKLNCNYNI